MRKINKSILDTKVLEKLSDFEKEFSACKKPISWNDPQVQDICNKYKDVSVKGVIEKQLEKDQKIGGVHTCCCYCECVVAGGNWDDIEHVIPKSKSPENALNWENLLLACNTCNRSNKNDNYTPGFLNVSNSGYVFEEHFEYGKSENKFILNGKSDEGNITLNDLKELKFDNHSVESRYENFQKMYDKIQNAKERGESKTSIRTSLNEIADFLGRNYTFSKWLISDDINSPLHSELY